MGGRFTLRRDESIPSSLGTEISMSSGGEEEEDSDSSSDSSVERTIRLVAARRTPGIVVPHKSPAAIDRDLYSVSSSSDDDDYEETT